MGNVGNVANVGNVGDVGDVGDVGSQRAWWSQRQVPRLTLLRKTASFILCPDTSVLWLATTEATSRARAGLGWWLTAGVCVHVQATNPVYQKENLYFSTFTLKETDMHALDNWDSTGYTAPSPYYADL